MPRRLVAGAPGFESEFAALLTEKREAQADVQTVVAGIVAHVRADGDAALIDYTERFDRQRLTAERLRVREDEIEAAADACDPAALGALQKAHARIVDYHRRQVPDDLDYTDDTGIRLGHRWTAVESAGLYVPGGTAAYPSSVLMTAVPARVAGVERLVMTVPAPDGVLNPLVLAAARIADVDTVYRIGGAQAIAALAYGTATVAPVDKIVGPGNAYVAAAKRQVFGTVGIDMIAGPSEILVVADVTSDPAWIAADLLSQAEHDTAAQALLFTDDAVFADAVEAAVESHLRALDRATTARASWDTYGAVVIVDRLADVVPLIDRVAPEHMELACAGAGELAKKVRNAGAIFLGHYTPEVVGDYLAGPSHVLPTGRTARFSSGLGVLDFMKRSSLIECSAAGLDAIGPTAITLARAEGFDAHALSVAVRLTLPRDG